jgi:predicted KAP-like P-loop ATPase
MDKKILREIEEIFENWDGVTLPESFFTAERLKWDKERGLLVEFDNSWVNRESDVIYYDVMESRTKLIEKWEDEIIKLIKKYNLTIEELNEYFEKLWEE